MKELMRLNPECPKTHQVPINPDTGKVWNSRLVEIREIIFDEREAAREGLREEQLALREKLEHLISSCEWRTQPLIQGVKLMMGATTAALRIIAGATFGPTEWNQCHPETWAALPEEIKAKFELIP